MNPVDKTNLISKKLDYARKTLLLVCNLLDEHNIPYHLEGGTLLGLVRDGDLLPWDGDLDISIPLEYAGQLEKMKWTFLKIGIKMSTRRSQQTHGPIQKGQLSIFKIKSLANYLVQLVWPKYPSVVLDIFVKVKDDQYTYWQANSKIMRVENRYYESFETISYRGKQLKVPNQYKAYLTEKYGDWSVVIKEWDCTENELTIVN
jgi:lipopolysaccharide cholinephosphotransferase